jgi:hypothetical protein
MLLLPLCAFYRLHFTFTFICTLCHVQIDRSAVIPEGVGGKEMRYLPGNDEVKNARK